MSPFGRPVLHHGAWTVYESEDHTSEDCRQREYTAVHSISKREKPVDVTGYHRANPEVLRAIIDLDFPTGRDLGKLGPLDAEDVIALLRARLAQQVAA